MKPIYLYDLGIQPWEQTTSVSDSRFATITVVHRSIAELLDLWLGLATGISHCLPRVVKWRTIGHHIEGSLVQELKLVKKLKSDLSKDDCLGKNRDSNIYSYVKRLLNSVHDFDLNTITQCRYTVLLFLPDINPSNRCIWEVFKDFDRGLEAKGMQSILSIFDDLLLCRLFENETHVSLQFLGVMNQVDSVIGKLRELGVERVEKKDIFKLISSQTSNPNQERTH